MCRLQMLSKVYYCLGFRKRKKKGSIEDNPTKRRKSEGLKEDILVPISCPDCAKQLFFESTMGNYFSNQLGN